MAMLLYEGNVTALYYGNKKNIPLIHELGLDIREYGGAVLRRAVSERSRRLVAYMLDQGVDNYLPSRARLESENQADRLLRRGASGV